MDEGGISTAIAEIGTDVYTTGAADPATEGMGTTVACVVLRRDRLIGVNVGDSRVQSQRGLHEISSGRARAEQETQFREREHG